MKGDTNIEWMLIQQCNKRNHKYTTKADTNKE